MVKRYTLNTPDEWEFQMIGITTALKDYRLAYFLNKFLYLDLSRSEELPAEIPGLPGSVMFSFYRWEEAGTSLSFYLISNRSSETFLIPQHKQADYFLVINGSLSHESVTRFLKSIRQIPNIITAFKINVKSDRKIDAFLTEMELHTMKIKQSSKKMSQ